MIDDDEYGAVGGMRIAGETKVLEKSWHSAILSNTNPT
jgi:hypothetical protein